MDVSLVKRNLAATILIFTTRSLFIMISSYLGGRAAGAPAEHYQRYWMGLLTQVILRCCGC